MLAAIALSAAAAATTAAAAATSGHYIMATIKSSKWLPADEANQPSMADRNLYGRSLDLCSFACQQDESIPCTAFPITDEKFCQFGEVDTVDSTGCQITVSKEVGDTIDVMLDTTVYGRKRVIEMQTPAKKNKADQPKDTFNETKCVGLFDMPVPQGGAFISNGGWAQYKDGGIVCGAHNDNRLECQSWQPGQDSWVKTVAKKFHTHAGAVYLGQGEVLVVGGAGDTMAYTEILDKNGVWSLKASNGEFPENLRQMKLIALSSQVVYSFGGASSDASLTPSKKVFKYTRAQDKWTTMPDMPLTTGGAYGNCAKVTFRSRLVVLCCGFNKEDTGKMITFDLLTETWQDTGKVAPTPPHFTSMLFVVGHTLYRYSGAEYAGTETPDWHKMDFFDLKTELWETPTDLTAGSYKYHRLLFNLDVTYKL